MLYPPFFFICLELSLSPTFVNLLRLLHEEKCWSFFLSYFVAVACVIQFCHQQQSEPQPQPQQRKAITWIIQTTWTSKQTNKQTKKRHDVYSRQIYNRVYLLDKDKDKD